MRYEVFARINPGDDLMHIGNVEAESDRLAKSHARTTYDEEDWDAMAIVRSTDFLEVPMDAPPDGQGDGS